MSAPELRVGPERPSSFSPAGAPVLVSACLAGVPCRYDGAAKPNARVIAMVEAGRALPLCAEGLGGLPTPRTPAEIRGGEGADVLAGRARVVDAAGVDVTGAFLAGARRVAEEAERLGVSRALLCEKSPSCGAGLIYDGSFSGRLVAGRGVLAALLSERGLKVEGASGD